MKKLTATFFTAFIISGVIGTLILFVMDVPLKQAIFTGVFSGLSTGTVLAVMARKNQRALKA